MAGNDYTSKSEQLSYRVFSGGLNSTANPLNLKDTELSDCQNVDFDKFGTVSKRNGYTALNTSAFNSGATWTSLHFLELSTGTDYIMGTCGNKLAKMDAFDGTWDDITGSLTITAGNNNLFVWKTFKDIAFGTNGVDVPIKWTGSGNGATQTVVTGLTKAKWIETWKNYFFMANCTVSGTAQPTRLYWSNINDPETWTVTDFNEIGFKDGQEITGIMELGDRLCIFKEHSVWIALFTGDVTIPFVFEKTQSSVGAISGYSLQKVNNGIKFLAQDGFYWFDGVDSQKLSNRVSTTIQGYEQSRLQYGVSAYQREDDRYWCSFTASGGTTHSKIITFDSFNDAYSQYTGFAANCFTVLRTSGAERIYFGDYSGYVYRADTGSNDSPLNVTTAINAYLKTKWMDFGDLVNVKGVAHAVLYFETNSTTMTVAYSYDLTSSDTYSTTFSMASINHRRIDLTGRGRLIRLHFSNAVASETFKVYGLGLLPHLETYT